MNMNLSETSDFELLALLLDEEGIHQEEDQFQIKRHSSTKAPASYQQRRLWFLHELEPTSSAYNICSVFRLDGSLQIEALELAFKQLQQRHESLRTTFLAIDGEPWQHIHSNVLSNLSLEDWSDILKTEIEQRVSAMALLEAQYYFDLEKGPLVRLQVYQLTPVQHILTLTFHHIIADGWSLGLIIEELTTLYHFALQGNVTGLEELKIQYADYAIWQQEKYTDSILEEHFVYWEKQLTELPILQFPTDFYRPSLQSFRGGLVNFSIPPSLTIAIRKFIQNEDVTLFMTLMAAFQVFLGRYSGQEDIPVGTSIANRPGVDSEKLIGFFVNMLVIRADLSGEPSFRVLAKRVKETVLQGFEHADVPFETLVERLHVERDTSRNPLFQIAFTLLNAPKSQLKTDNLAVTLLANQEAARFDLELLVTESEDSLSGIFSYNTDLFVRETVETFAHHFCNLLENLVMHPDTPVCHLPILLPEEYAQLMPPAPRQSFLVEYCLHEVFSQQAALRPHQTALIFEKESLTYEQLNERANRFAHHLIHLGVGPESRVGLWVNRSLEMVVAILAVLKAGGTYVPFDPDYPPERVVYMLKDSQVSVLLTQVEFEKQLPPHQAQVVLIDQHEADLAGEKPTDPEVIVHPDNAAYIIYTSGSTGKPKGVVVTHRNVVRLMLATEKWFHFNEKDVWTLFHSYAFDFSVWEMWGAFFFGGRLIIVPYLVSRSAEDFYNLLCDSKVTVLNQTPSAFRQLMQAEEVICRESELNLRYVIFGGEALDLESLEPWFDRHDEDFPLLVNMYGITETTVHVTYRPIRWRDVKKRQGCLIGEPIPDLSLYLLDPYGQPVPVGVVGEIYVGGAGVTRGYLHRPQLTAERMIPNPANPLGKDRLYKTGDLARYLRNGEIEYLGRNDHQVKIRGFRIELGEVEAVLQRLPGVRIAHVMTQKESQKDFRLVAYIVPQTDLTKIPEYETFKREQTKEWQFTFDEIYGSDAAEVNEDFNISGWNSSYDGQPISPEQMREWLDNTLIHIAALTPQRVLEIGCGTGMILLNVAPNVECYWANDFSPQAISRLENINRKRQLSGVRLMLQEAIDFSNIPEAYFDTIVINSVAQYFPSLEYFQQVIAGALRALAPGGSIFIGDNRHLPTLSAFHASVAFFQATDQTDWQAFTAQVQHITEKENELVIDPAFFVNLPKVFQTVDTVEVHLKGEKAHNELTKYRYDVILHTKGGSQNDLSVEPIWEDWKQATDLRQNLENRHGRPIGWRGIPNARLMQDVAILQWYEGNNGFATVGDLRKDLQQLNQSEAVDPGNLQTLAQDIGYQLTISYSKDFGSSYFDACFYPATDTNQKRRCPVMPITQDSISLKSTHLDMVNPLKERFAKALITELKLQVWEQLPEYMRPSSFVLLEKLPMTPSGKLDLRSLPRPERETAIANDTLIRPITSTQERLCKLWQDVLGLDSIGIEDDFFALGGHSLLATRLVSRIREEFNLAFPLREVFEHPTVASLAEQIDQLALTSNHATTEEDVIPRVTQRENLPLSFAQQRLWFLDRLEPNNPAYNIVVGFHLNGYLHQEALHHSLQEIVKRHEVLRTTFSQDAYGNPVQVIHESNEVPLTITDLSHWQRKQREAKLQKAAMVEAIRPFNLQTGPLLRVHIYRLEEDAHVFVAVMHHIVSDGWSFGLMVKELSLCYAAFCRGEKTPLASLNLQYADFAHWQRTTFEKTQLQSQLDYWKQELTGEIQSLELPTDFIRPAVTSYDGRTISFTVDRKNYEGFKNLCESQGVTLFMGLLGVFKTLLMRYSQQHDLLVGTPIANRNHKQTEDLIGFFVNTLVIRTDLSGNPSFIKLLEQIKEKTLLAYAHQDLPFERLVEELQPERNFSHNPLFQVMFVLQNVPMGNLELPKLILSSLDMDSVTAKFDVTLSMMETEEGLQGRWEYKTDLFTTATITRMAEHFQTLLEGIVANPEQHLTELPLLTAAEQHQLLVEWNNTQMPYPQDLCIYQMFEAQVERTPNAIAVVFEDQQLTYRELNTQANQLAYYLQSLGVKLDTLVAICVERSPEMLVGILGILKAGAAYLPLDPAYPQDRLAFMLSDAQPAVLLTQQFLLEGLPDHEANYICLDTFWEIIAQQSEDNPNSNMTSDNLAYVIYTSGSTGKPKGVQITHKNLVHSLTARLAYYPEPVTSFLLLSSLAFDASVPGIFWTLCQGGTLHLPPEDSQWELAKLIEMIARNDISHLISLPSLYTMFLEQAQSEQLASLKTVILAAESFSKELVSAHFQKLPETSLLNEYGPTEGTVWSSVYDLSPQKQQLQIAIGRPIANTQLYILDQALQSVPIGVTGELYIHGTGLARGYLNRPGLTAEKFIPHPFNHQPSARLYKTGDLACYLPDGNIEFLGRIDNQVKIRGFRIELGEIEVVLGQHLAVREAVVLVHEDQPGEKYLVAYVTSYEEQMLSPTALRRFLQEKLPDYMMPGSFVMLDTLPLMPNGKVDRRALKDSNSTARVRSGKQIPPRTLLEQKLAQLWEEVLQVSLIGVTENFFDLGGHSLLAIRLLAEIEKQLGYSLPLVTFFREGTIEKIAAILEGDRQSNHSELLIPLQIKGNQPPLFLVHQHGGYAMSYSVLARNLGKEQPLYALQARGLDGKQQPLDSIPAMASSYLKVIRDILPNGPYLLGGHSFGGLVAFEIASQLEAIGEPVEHLLIIDTHPPLPTPELKASLDDHAALLTFFVEQICLHFNEDINISYEDMSTLEEAEQLEYVLQLLRSYELLPPDIGSNFVTGFINVYKSNSLAILRYEPQPIQSSISVLKTRALTKLIPEDPTVGWSKLTNAKVRVYPVIGDHQTILKEPDVKNLAETIQQVLLTKF